MEVNLPYIEVFKNSIKKFDEIENLRGEIYWRCLNLIDKNLKFGEDQVESRLDAYLLLLASWNVANFRKTLTEDFDTFKTAISSCEEGFSKFEDKNFENIDFEEYRSDISNIFNKLSKVNAILYTGASKVMHLRNPKVFLMWDVKIRGREGYKIKGEDGNAYVDFLKKVQSSFSKIFVDINKILLEDKHKNKTVTKAIDEYNYVTITQINK
ncbi:hypothetical protein M1585_04820 [Candidatus Parvarchaeota archaeon]|nr:hypothetical protein [Candidatus Parvarchaeota archaeon]